MHEMKVTLTQEDFDLSPGLAEEGYSVGMTVTATIVPPYKEGDGWPNQNALATANTEGTWFVGGHPIKGRNG